MSLSALIKSFDKLPMFESGLALYLPLWDSAMSDNDKVLDLSKNHNNGARTASGVLHFTGSATSNVNCGAIHNASAKLWVSFWFKLDQEFSSANGADLRLFGKFVSGANYIRVYLDAANGALVFASIDGGVWHFLITVATSWNAGQWYNVIASMSDVAGMRLRIDGGVAVVNPAYVDAVPNGGDFVIGDSDDPGAGTGFEGIIADFFCEEGTDLSVLEETDLYNGIPPATVDNEYLLDEGRGVTAVDRGADNDPGTLDTTATWAWGQVQQPVLSLDGRNDRGESSDGIDISGDLTMVLVIKAGSTYDGLSGSKRMFTIAVNGDEDNNRISLAYLTGTDLLFWECKGGGAASILVTYSTKPAIGDYLILIGTKTVAGNMQYFVQGSLVGTDTGAGVVTSAAAIAYFGMRWNAADFDVSKTLMAALIDGAFTQQQARAYSRYLKNVFNLPIVI